jgi:predicted nucleotide-binding protein
MTHHSPKGQVPSAPTSASVAPTVGITLLQQLIERAGALKAKADLSVGDIDAWKMMAREFLIRTFGTNSSHVDEVLNAGGGGGIIIEDEIEDWLRSSIENKIKLLQSCIEVLESRQRLQLATDFIEPDSLRVSPVSKRIFIVHGHNLGLKDTVARFLDNLGLEPVVLHEQPNSGRTIIEKFLDFADVQFAVVLLTGDDEGKQKSKPDPLTPRPRQNVILELGFFLGRLGRPRVCAIYESGVTIPSDYDGVLFLPLDSNNGWKIALVKELKAAGIQVDANRIFGA